MKTAARWFLTLSVMVVLGIPGRSPVARAQGTFKISRVDKGELHAQGPVSILRWSPETEMLHAGTLTGGVMSWTLAPPAGEGTIRLAGRYPGDALATLMTAGTSHDALSGGIAPLPKVALLPGGNVGQYKIAQVQGAFPHFATRRVAVLCADRILVMEDPSATPVADLAGRYGLVSWIDPSAPNQPPRLAAYNVGRGTIQIWSAGKWTEQDSHSIGLPRVPPTQGGGAWEPLVLSCATGTTPADTFFTGDDRGSLRSWSASATFVGKTDLKDADMSAFSRDGSILITHEGQELFFHRPFEQGNPLKLGEVAEALSSLKHLQLGGKHLVAAAWPRTPDVAANVDLFVTGQAKAALKPHDTPNGPATALGIRPDALQLQVAAAVADQGVIFFEPDGTTPAAPGAGAATKKAAGAATKKGAGAATKKAPVPAAKKPAAPVAKKELAPAAKDTASAPAADEDLKEDAAIVTLAYSSDGKWLVAIGNSVSLYDPAGHKLLATSPAFPLADSAKLLSCDVILDPPGSAAPPPSARVLLGTSTGQLELWKAELKVDSVVITRLAASGATSLAIRGVALDGDLAIATQDKEKEKEIAVWQVADSQSNNPRFVPLERVLSGGPIEALALAPPGRRVAYRVGKVAARRSISAGSVDSLGSERLSYLVHRNADFLVVAAASGTLFTRAGATIAKIANADPVTSLALGPEGKTLLAGVRRNNQGLVLRWKVENNTLSGPTDFTQPGPDVTSLLFGADEKAFYAGDRDGRLVRYSLPNVAPAVLELRLANANKGARQLAWRPARQVQGSAAPGEPDFDRLLVAAGGNTLSMRRLSRIDGPPLAFTPKAPHLASPWYGSAFDPDSPSVALANAAGQVWISNWPFPRDLNGHEPDLTALAVRPALGDGSVSPRPIYALAWSRHYQSQTPAKPLLLAAGAEGRLYLGSATAWDGVPTKNPNQPVYAMAAHPTTAVLALGHGRESEASPQRVNSLSVWPETLKAADSRFWDGHRDTVRALAFSDDGKRLASVDRDGLMLVWDCESITKTNVERPLPSPYELKPMVPTSVTWLGPTGPDCCAVGFEDGQVWVMKVTK